MAQAAAEGGRIMGTKEATVAKRLDRSVIDRLISWTGAVLAVSLIALGGAAIFGGTFAMENVRDRLEPQNISFSPAEQMSPEEKAEVGEFAGATVDTGIKAEAYSRLIGLHVAEIADGQTYADLGGVQFGLQAQIEEASGTEKAALEEELAGVMGQRDTLFKGETLRAILLNAYGWWMVGQIALYAGIAMVIAGLFMAVLAFLGFRHARKTA